MGKIKDTIIEEDEKSEEAFPDEVEQRAAQFHHYSKVFRAMVRNLRKKNSAGNVLEALLFDPLEPVELKSNEEKDLLDVCRNLMYNRAIIENYFVEEKIKQEETQSE